LEAALQAWALAQLATQIPQPGARVREQRRVLALDGKTVRGARAQNLDGIAYQPHLVSVIDQASGAVLGQVQVDTKGSEITAFTRLLDQLDLRDVLVSADALHTHRGHARYLHERGGHYLMTAKAHQPTLLRRLRALPSAQIGVGVRERARGHGHPHDQSGELGPLP
jgi:hypothetical protein